MRHVVHVDGLEEGAATRIERSRYVVAAELAVAARAPRQHCSAIPTSHSFV